MGLEREKKINDKRVEKKKEKKIEKKM